MKTLSIKIILTIIIASGFISCSTPNANYYKGLNKPFRPATEKSIKLLSNTNKAQLIIENYYSIICIPIDTVFKYIDNYQYYYVKCDKRTAYYQKFAETLKQNYGKSFYYIDRNICEIDVNTGVLFMDSTKYRTAYQSRRNYHTVNSQNADNFSFKLSIDTIGNIKLGEIPERLVAVILSEGGASIYNKITGKYEANIYFDTEFARTSRFRLLFNSKIPFLQIFLGLDNVDPDNECEENNDNFWD